MSLKKSSPKNKLADTHLVPVAAAAQQDGTTIESSSNLKGSTELGAECEILPPCPFGASQTTQKGSCASHGQAGPW